MRCVAMPKPPPAMPPAMPHGACSYFPRCDAPTVLHASPRLRRAPRRAGREATTSAPCRQVWRAVRGGGAAARSEPRGRRHTDPGARRCAHSATPAARCRGAACASSHPPLSSRTPPLTLLSRLARRRPRVVPIRRALRARTAQDGKLPLHYATAKDETTLKVVTLLLEANPQAAETADKARQRAHACHRVCCHRIAVSHAPLLHVVAAATVRPADVARARAMLRRTRSIRCTTPLRRARRWR